MLCEIEDPSFLCEPLRKDAATVFGESLIGQIWTHALCGVGVEEDLYCKRCDCLGVSN